jgi:hypothetical protein
MLYDLAHIYLPVGGSQIMAHPCEACFGFVKETVKSVRQSQLCCRYIFPFRPPSFDSFISRNDFIERQVLGTTDREGFVA